MKISVILPIYNEGDNLREMYKQLKSALGGAGLDHEIIAVNDGSADKSAEILKEIAGKDSLFKVINFKKNYGQTAAISAGIDASAGEVIIPLDADLQNDPADIPKFLEKINEGYDVVSGWRKNRQDKLVTRRIPSWTANRIISKITGVRLHDYGCTMKAYRSDVIKNVRLYGEMHRFMPAYSAWHGAKTTEIVVNHRLRIYGKTKYDLSRTFGVVLDLLTVKFLTNYLAKPMHFFGLAGFWTFFVALGAGILALFLRVFFQVHLIQTPLPLLTTLLILVGLQFILMGLLAEILIRIYYESSNRPAYLIKEKINF
ncbi:glycosyltransferase family 2 protein [Patescibacteria group bacterium]|nr:glycosyltransferase family 2 protein [Patescibacteria group bacterium]